MKMPMGLGKLDMSKVTKPDDEDAGADYNPLSSRDQKKDDSQIPSSKFSMPNLDVKDLGGSGLEGSSIPNFPGTTTNAGPNLGTGGITPVGAKAMFGATPSNMAGRSLAGMMRGNADTQSVTSPMNVSRMSNRYRAARAGA